MFECAGILSLADVREKIELRRQDYNQVRPHSSLDDHPQAIFARQWEATAPPRPESHPDGRRKAVLTGL
jgi:hypothetical protein